MINNPTKDKEWAGLFSAIGTSGRTRDWVVSIGNHEQCLLIKCKSHNAQAFRNYFAFANNSYPKQAPTWFYVDYPGVRVVVLDSFAGDAATTQTSFLSSALAGNKQPFSIVLMHAPVFTSAAGRRSLPQARAIGRVIEKYDVDLVLTGHDHSYARGYRVPNRTVYVTSVSGPEVLRRRRHRLARGKGDAGRLGAGDIHLPGDQRVRADAVLQGGHHPPRQVLDLAVRPGTRAGPLRHRQDPARRQDRALNDPTGHRPGAGQGEHRAVGR